MALQTIIKHAARANNSTDGGQSLSRAFLAGKRDDSTQALAISLNTGPRAAQLKAMSGLVNGTTAPDRQAAQPSDRLPEDLAAGVEWLSGVSMADVRVHRNSPQPAQLNALAFAQGRDIHLAPGQERHLPHEAWHIVQQARGRVPAIRQLQAGARINDDPRLEAEADALGGRALAIGATVQRQSVAASTAGALVVQRVHPHHAREGGRPDLTERLGAEVAQQILDTHLDEDAALDREALTIRFCDRGGSPWEALRLLRRFPDSNENLRDAYEFFLRERDNFETYDATAERDPRVVDLLPGLEDSTDAEIIATRQMYIDAMNADAERAAELQLWVAACNLMLKRRLQDESGHFSPLLQMHGQDGLQISVYGGRDLRDSDPRMAWLRDVANAMLHAPYLIESRVPLKIRLIVHDRISRDIASTSREGGFITINIERYQLDDFSVGQMVGLITHEIGVHSLDATRLEEQALVAEALDRDSQQTGPHEGRQYTVGRTPPVDGQRSQQQDDHLTIGRAILGQLTAAPRLNMYERTMLSLLEALPANQRREAAAAYCIDIARIIATNDTPPTTVFGGLAMIRPITKAAVAEWQRIQNKYRASHPVVDRISIGNMYILKCLGRLALLVSKVKDAETFL